MGELVKLAARRESAGGRAVASETARHEFRLGMAQALHFREDRVEFNGLLSRDCPWRRGFETARELEKQAIVYVDRRRGRLFCWPSFGL